MKPNAIFRAILILALGVFTARAEVRLHHLFTDHMVLQQGTSVPVWGWADDGDKITVEYGGQKTSTSAKGGKWMAKLKNLKPGAPDTLRVRAMPAKGGNETLLQVSDVVVGEVWIASG